MNPETWILLDRTFADIRRIAGGAITIARDVPSEVEILAAQEQLGCTFHPDYVAFLSRYGGATVGPFDVFGLRPVEVMDNDRSVVDNTLWYRDQGWPDTEEWYVISEDGYGNPIGVARDGRVMTSDHDFGGIDDYADDFEDFLLSYCLRRTGEIGD